MNLNPEIYSMDDRLVLAIDQLTRAINICHEADFATPEQQEADYTKHYAYTSGYSRSAMSGALEILNGILYEMREKEIDTNFGSDYENGIDYDAN